MRRGPALALLAAVSMAGPAAAQVTVNPGALELLPQAPARTPPAQRPPPPRPAPRPQPQAASRPAATPAPPPVPPKPPPAVPVAPPAIAAIPPAVPVPVAHPPPAPVVPVAPDAPGAASPVPGGLRITFGAASSDLNPGTEAAIRSFARGVKGQEQTAINLYAYAAGSTEDPSTPRRLSLARALAARAVLINEGIVSTRIYPRALGPAGGDADRDRVDMVAGPPGPPR